MVFDQQNGHSEFDSRTSTNQKNLRVMWIRKDKVVVYDIEVFPNVFHCCCKDTETGKVYKYTRHRPTVIYEDGMVDWAWMLYEKKE